MARFGGRWQALVLAVCGLVLQPGAASPDPKDKFLEHVNGKRLRNVLVLGMYCTREDAEAFLRNGAVNPVNGERFDAVFAVGMDGKSLVGHLWEGTRVVADNLSWSIQTNYEQFRGLQVDNIVAHSNGNDVLSNALKAGYIKARHFYALAPPKGFRDEARSLPVETVHIRWNKGDTVPESLGKGILMKPLQKLGDLDVGLSAQPGADGTKNPMLGLTVRRPLPGEPKGPAVDEVIYEGPAYPFPLMGRVYLSERAYQDLLQRHPGARATLESHASAFTDHLTDKGSAIDLWSFSAGEKKALGAVYKILEGKQSGPHYYRSIANSVALERIYGAEQSRASDADLRAVKARAPEAAAMVAVPDYWTSEGPDKSRGQTLSEAGAMTGLIPDWQHVVVVGRGEAADLMERTMLKRLGRANVKRLLDDPGPEALQREARAMGLATAILGVHTPGGAGSAAPRDADAARTAAVGMAVAARRPHKGRPGALSPLEPTTAAVAPGRDSRRVIRPTGRSGVSTSDGSRSPTSR